MASPKLVEALANTALATAFGGPVAGVSAAATETVKAIVAGLPRAEKDRYQTTLARLERDLAAFGRGEGISAAVVDHALLESEEIIRAHGPTVSEMVALKLDAAKVSRLVLARAGSTLAQAGEATEELCRRIVPTVYAALLADDQGLPGLEAAYRRGTLERLGSIEAGVAAIRVALTRPAAADLRELYRGLLDRYARFAGREEELRVLDAAPTGYVCVSAPAGYGKSALLAHWVSGRDDVAYAFVNGLAGTADEVLTLQALLQQLLPAADRDAPLPADAIELRARVGGLLARSPGGGRAIVVVDGLDEAAWPFTGLLPLLPPPGRTIVLSRRADDDAWVRDLGLPPAAVTHVKLGALGLDEVTRLLAGHEAFAPRLLEVSGGDPLLVGFLVEDVRDGRVASVAELGDPAGLKGYFDRWWEQITAALTGPPLRDLLGYLLAARGPIAAAELVAVSPGDHLDQFGAPPFNQVLKSVRRFLSGDDAALSLGHPRFARYLREGPFPEELIAEYEDRLRGYCAAKRTPYSLAHLAEHLRDAGLTAELDALLSDPAYIDAKLRALGIDALVADYPPGDRIGTALRRARVALAREPAQLASQLYGRLVGQLAGLDEIAPEHWLAARSPAMAIGNDLDGSISLEGTIGAVAFGELDGTMVLAVGADSRIELHDPLKGKSRIRTLPNDGREVTALCLGTLDGQSVLVVASPDALVIRHATTGAVIGEPVPLPWHATSVALGILGESPAIAAAGDGAAAAWDAHTGAPVALAAHARVGGVTTVAGRLALHVLDGDVPRIADAGTGDPLTPAGLRGIALAPETLASAEVGEELVLALLWQGGVCGVWSAATGDAIGPNVDLTGGPISRLAVAGVGGRAIVAASLGFRGTGVIMLREAGERPPARRSAPMTPTDWPLEALRADDAGAITALTGAALRLQAVHHDGERLFTPLGEPPDDATVGLLLTGAPLGGFTKDGRLRIETDLSEPGPPASARCWGALDGRPVLTAGSQGAARVWDLASGRRIGATFVSGAPHTSSVALGDDGRLAVAAGGRVHLWDAATGDSLPTPDTGGEHIHAVALGSAGRLITGSRGGVLRVWDGQAMLAGVTLDASVEYVWAVRGADTVAAHTADGQLHFFDVRRRARAPAPA